MKPVALVTGARRGIGLGIAKALASKGFDLAITDIVDDAASQSAIKALKKLGAKAVSSSSRISLTFQAMARQSRPPSRSSATSIASSTMPVSAQRFAETSSILSQLTITRFSTSICAEPCFSRRPY